MSTERSVVDAKIADLFVERFAAKAKSLSVGHTHHGAAVLGSLVDRAVAERVTSPVLDAVAKGARLHSASLNGTLIRAHVLDHVAPDVRVYQEKKLGGDRGGPHQDEDEAIRSSGIRPSGSQSSSLVAPSTAPSGWRGG